MEYRKMTVEKYRKHDWISTKTGAPQYGIQTRIGRYGWATLSIGKGPVIFTTESERNAEFAALTAPNANA